MQKVTIKKLKSGNQSFFTIYNGKRTKIASREKWDNKGWEVIMFDKGVVKDSEPIYRSEGIESVYRIVEAWAEILTGVECTIAKEI